MGDRRLYNCQDCTSVLRSSKGSKNGVMQFATEAAKRLGFVKKYVLCSFQSWRRAKV